MRGCIGVMVVAAAVLMPVSVLAQVSDVEQKMTDNSKILPDGTAYVTRVVPVPKTISPEAQAMLARVVSDAASHPTIEQQRAGTDKWQAGAGEVSKELYPVNVAAATIAGVPVRVVTPLTMAPEKQNRVLINVHGEA
jgi:epsilon-lactone hydrolase